MARARVAVMMGDWPGGRSTIRQVSAAALLFLLTLAPSALGQTRDDNWKRCGSDQIELRIGACTTIIRSGVETDHSLANAFYNRADSYRRQGEFTRALDDYDQAIRLHSLDIDFFNGRGLAHQGQREYDKA